MFYFLIGALTLKPYAFKARPWELTHLNSIDIFDSTACNIKIELRGRKILRILPRQNDFLNENWITDKVRLSFDANSNQRLGSPLYIYNKKFIKTNWPLIIQLISLELFFADFLRKHAKLQINLLGLTSDSMTNENLIFFKDWLNFWGSSNLISFLNFTTAANCKLRSNFLFQTSCGFDQLSNCFILFGLNPRIENPIFNLKLRYASLKKHLSVISIGTVNNPNFFIKSIGNSVESFVDFVEGRHRFLLDFSILSNSFVFVGHSILYRADFFFIENLLNQFCKYTNSSFSYIYNQLAFVGTAEYGFIPGTHSIAFNANLLLNKGYNIIFNLNNVTWSPKLSVTQQSYHDWCFSDISIYFGSFGNNNLIFSNYIMPLTTFLEESGSFINYKGGKQKMSNIVNGYRGSLTFYAFYFKSLLYLNKFSINKTSLFLVKNKRLGSLGMSYDISSFFSLNTRTLSKSGFLTRNIVNNFNNNFYISNVYTAHSASMLKLKKAKVDFFNPNFF